MDVATEALRDIIYKLLPQLLRHEKYKMKKGVRHQEESLVRVLKSIHNHIGLLDVAEVDRHNEQIKNWAREIREASYNIEDRIDTFLVSVDGCREPIEETCCWWLKRATKKMGDLPTKGRARVDIAAAMEDIMKQLQEVSERLARFTAEDFVFRPLTSTSITVDPRLPALYRNERELVGIEEAREELVRLLTQGDAEDDKKRELKVVYILGLAGVGKTTLAKAVYNRLQAQFDCSAFVSVSPKPDLEKVFRDILLELDEAKYHTVITAKRDMPPSQFMDQIQEFLENKRYLIVIDDIWSVRCWEAISLALPLVYNGSRIITTSRISDVAVVGRGARYRLKPLSHANSEKLFYKRIFGGEGIVPGSQYAEVSDRILKKCGGIPLAIVTVASVLASKPLEEWSEVYNSIASRHQSNRYVDNMRKVLSFSFYDLPAHSRACLLHLSIFPENCFIEKDFLIWKWVAEGFVRNEEGLVAEGSLFEIGESYINELVNCSTIEIAVCLNNGCVYGCRVHPVLLSQIRAISSEENFCTVLEDDHHTSPGNNNPRRIAMHGIRNVEHNIVPAEANISMEKVRSFNASLCFVHGMPQLSRFQVLRVLALEYCPGMNNQHRLKQIGRLVHLRYLGLVGAGVLELPEETLEGLRFLQTLDLRETDIERWPGTISWLVQLKCLCVRRTRTVPEGMMGSLRCLEDLRLHLVSSNSLKLAAELIRMKRLRVLVLGFQEMDVELEKAWVESLGKLPDQIQRLEIIYYCKPSTRAVTWEESRWVPPRHLRQLVLGGLLFSRLPSWINPSFLPYLSRLHLGVEVLEDGDLETLAIFPKLRSLVLMAAASDEQQHHITTVVRSSYYAFNKLNFFSTNMAVRFETGRGGPPMPNLEHVELRVRVAQCADSWLSSLANLPSLDKVTVLLDCQGASAVETVEAEETLRRATGIHPNSLNPEVTKQNGNDELPLIEQFRFKDPRFEALRSEMEKIQANQQGQDQRDNDSDEEITLAKAASE